MTAEIIAIPQNPGLLIDTLAEMGTTPEEGRRLIAQALKEQPAVANAALCGMYDVVCYNVGDSCFRDQTPACDHAKWFVSVVSGSQFDKDVAAIPLADSEEAAQAIAVDRLRLDHLFLTLAA